MKIHLRSTRGRLVLWYLSVVAALLLGLGIVQSITLRSYMTSSAADSMRQAAMGELTVLGHCFIRSSADLRSHAQTLVEVLGGHDTAAKVVTPSGAALAERGLGPPGATHPFLLSLSTIRTVIRQANAGASSTAPGVPASDCKKSPLGYPRYGHHGTLGSARPKHPTTEANGLLLLGLPLGLRNHPVGYVILGQSLSPIDDTVTHVRLIFTLAALVALLVAALVALPIINQALGPLRRVAKTAESIAAGDLEKRANLALSPDEVGRLGKAFDRMVDRLQAALESATASEARMRQFLADASHELRTPLTVLRGTAQILLRHGDTQTPELKEALVAMHEETVRLSRLVDDLLTLSRLDAGQQLEPRPVALGDFLTRFIDRYAPAWPDRALEIDPAVDGTTAYVDPDALTRILTNLVDNAARYSAPGHPIELGASAVPAGVEIRVSDEGPGLKKEDAERVFERFYRASKSRARQSGGTGLGLSIVHALVQESGGEVRIETGPDRGTTVAVSLPRQQTEETRQRYTPL